MIAVGAPLIVLLHLTVIAIIPFFLAYVILMYVTFLQFVLWKCPRCRRTCGRFNYACKHCGLIKWGSTDEKSTEVISAEAASNDGVL